MPIKPMSHERRQYLKRAKTEEAKGQRRLQNQEYGQRRRELHGPDPRSTARWRRLRTIVLNHEPLCGDPYHHHKGRPIPATEVDHIRPLHDNPDLCFDEANLQPLCTPCHAVKSARERRGLSDVWLIAGPPGAGKSTYVRHHMLPGDMVVDWDRFLEAISGREWDGLREWTTQTERLVPYAWAAYDGVVTAIAKHLQQAKRGAERVHQPITWVIGTLAECRRRRDLAMKIGARCIVLACPADLCMVHIASDPQRQHDLTRWHDLVSDWWARYEPDDADEVLSPP